MNKKRILLCNDAHFLYTGYGKYGKELLTRLHNTNKYEIAELALGGLENDSRMKQEVPWKHYPAAISSKDKYSKQFMSNINNKYGMWNFDDVCIDFKPDIVININDPWMMSFIPFSPVRKFFHWVVSPTVDSGPQKTNWIDMFCNADGVLTYSEYGKNLLKEQGNIDVFDIASPGVDHDIFKPLNKNIVRKNIGLDEDSNIIGTVMRNQPRKLYPDLFDAFRKFIDLCYEKDYKSLAEKSFLYIHTCYPDSETNWDMPLLLKEFGIARKVLFTYICTDCDNITCCNYRGSRTVCGRCNRASCIITNSNHGVSEQWLSAIINSFDLYVQYSSCEGFGMPQLEAVACGVPVMSVDYSAMQDIIKNCDAMPIPVERMFREPIIDAYRALPDNGTTSRMIMRYFSLPNDMRKVKNQNLSDLSKEYSWDKNAKTWERYIDQVELTGSQGDWENLKIDTNIPNVIPKEIYNSNNSVFVHWLVTEVLKKPELSNSRFALALISKLNYGFNVKGNSIISYDKKQLFKDTVNLIKQGNNIIEDLQ